jgi:hypothetical protein
MIVERNQGTQKGHYLTIMQGAPVKIWPLSIYYTGSPLKFHKKIFSGRVFLKFSLLDKTLVCPNQTTVCDIPFSLSKKENGISHIPDN